MMLSTLRLSNIFLSAISFQDDIDYIGKIIKTEGLVLIIQYCVKLTFNRL